MSTTGSEEPVTGITLEGFIQQTASRLWHGYRENRSREVAELATLRRTFPHDGRPHPDAFKFLGDQFAPRRQEDEFSRDELAGAAALALYAVHQQSNHTASAHWRGADHRLGRAAFALKRSVGPSGEAGVGRRMDSLIVATDIRAVLEHLRALVQLMRAHRVQLDYAQLALDLRAAQSPIALRTTQIRWSRDYQRTAPTETSGDQE